MFELKPLAASAVPAALEKAERYRLLNEPGEAESICRDVLEVEADNQQALIVLLLSLTDQFGRKHSARAGEAREIVERLRSDHDRAYYGGIVFERQAKAALKRGGAGSGSVAYEQFCQAMGLYERAAELATGDDNDATLRWNACARTMNHHPHVAPAHEDSTPDMLE